MLHSILMTESGKRKTIYRKIWQVSYNSKEHVHEGWIRYKGEELRVRLVHIVKVTALRPNRKVIKLDAGTIMLASPVSMFYPGLYFDELPKIIS